MLKRRSQLYEKAGPADPDRKDALDPDMYQTLKEQGVTVESLKKAQETFEARDAQERMRATQRELDARFGPEESKAYVKIGREIVKRFATPDDKTFLEESGLGNNVDFIETLAKLGKMLQAGREELRLSKKRRKK
jgi:hypothetical protein